MSKLGHLYIGSRRQLKANVLHDSAGFIIDPDDVRYRCGWGPTEKEAINHCLERNGIR